MLCTAEQIFCAPCASLITPIVSLILPVTKHLSLTVYAAAAYTPPVKSLITKKFSGDVVASHQLAHLMVQNTPLAKSTIDYLVPVPLHWTRYASRGFNQAYEMATKLGTELKVPVARLLYRHRRTDFQSTLSADKRQDNVKKAFALSPWYKLTGTHFLENKHVVIVDDLCTTGATLVNVAKTIAPYKPASLTAVVGCRAI